MKVPDHILRNIFVQNVPKAKKHSRYICVGRCVKCGDSKKDRKKRRLLLLTSRDPSVVYCHNCGYNTTAVKFIKTFFPVAYDSIIKQIYESYKDESVFDESEKKALEEDLNSSSEFEELVSFLKTECTNLGSGLLGNQEKKAIKYLQGRKIPEKKIEEMYYCSNPSSEDTQKYQDYIIVPFYNEFDVPYYFQGRYFGKDKRARFISSKFECCPDKALFNEKKVDPSKTVFVLEGTFDSLNIENSISITGCGINNEMIDYISKKFPDLIWLNDNDDPGRKLTEKLCKMNMKCFIWPKSVKAKDINDLAIMTNREIIPDSWLKKNSYLGSRGLFMML